MTTRAARWQRKVLYSWLWRSQPNSPLQDLTKAEKLYNRYQVTIEIELVRLRLENKITRPENAQLVGVEGIK